MNAYIEAVIAGIALALLMRAIVHIGWGTPLPLGLPLLITIAEVAHPKQAAVAFITAALILGAISAIKHYRRGTFRWTSARMLAACLAATPYWVANTHASKTKLTIAEAASIFLITAAVFMVELLHERQLNKRLDRGIVWKAGMTYITAYLSALLLSLAWRASDINLAMIPVIVAAVLWYGSKSVADNQRTVLEATATMATFPELTTFAPQGQSQRLAMLARKMGERAKLGPTRIDRISRAAMVARIGYIAYPDVNSIHEGYAIPTRDDLVRHTHEILDEANFLKDVTPIVDEFLGESNENETLECAIIRVVVNFDDLMAESYEEHDQEDITTALHRTEDLCTNKVERHALQLLHDVISEESGLIDQLASAGDLREEIRREIEARMEGRLIPG